MNHYSAKPVRLDLQPSVRLTAVLVAAMLAACGAILALPFASWIKLAGMLPLIAAAAFHILRDARLRLRSSILAIEVGSDGTLRYLTRAAGWREAIVRGDSFVTPALTVLVLATEERRFPRYAILVSDSGHPEMFRRLRVWLRWGSQVLPAEN
jgi:toxin CptA